LKCSLSFGSQYRFSRASLLAQQVKNPPAMQEACVQDGMISRRRRNIPVFSPEKALRGRGA